MPRLAFVLALLLVSALGSAQLYTREWTQLFKGDAAAGDDVVAAVAVDSAGNVIVTGSSGDGETYDIYTVKYSPTGAELWRRKYDNGDSDEAFDVAIDPSGGIWVGGASRGATTLYDAVVINYSAAGVQNAAIRFEGTGQDYARKIRIRKTSSGMQVYAFCYSANDMMLMQVRADAGVLWKTRIDGSAKSTDFPTDLELHSGGGVYACGYLTETGTGKDAAVIKFDEAGNEVWRRIVNGSESSEDFANAIAVNEDGSVSMVGALTQNPGDYDMFHWRYSAAGNQVGASTYGLSGEDIATDVAMDSSGFSYITGRSYGGPTDMDLVVMKNDPTCAGVWLRRMGSAASHPDAGKAITLDRYKYVYVLGSTGSFSPDFEGQNDGITFKLSGASGSSAGFWGAQEPAPSGGTVDPVALTTDEDVNVYAVATVRQPGSGNDYGILKYIQAAIPIDDIYSVDANRTLTVSAASGVRRNDLYALTAQAASGPVTAGTKTFNLDGSFTYNPDAANTGDQSFPYKLWKAGMESAVRTVRLRVHPVPKTLTTPTPTVPGGRTVDVTLTLTGKAPTGGTSTSLIDDSAALVTPSNAVVPLNATSVVFKVGTAPVSATATRKITASRAGAAVSLSITLTPAALDAITVSPSTVKGGSNASGLARLNSTTASSRVVALTDDSSAITVPPSVSIPAGASTGAFTVSTSAVTATATRRVIATLDGVTRSANLTLTP